MQSVLELINQLNLDYAVQIIDLPLLCNENKTQKDIELKVQCKGSIHKTPKTMLKNAVSMSIKKAIQSTSRFSNMLHQKEPEANQ